MAGSLMSMRGVVAAAGGGGAAASGDGAAAGALALSPSAFFDLRLAFFAADLLKGAFGTWTPTSAPGTPIGPADAACSTAAAGLYVFCSSGGTYPFFTRTCRPEEERRSQARACEMVVQHGTAGATERWWCTSRVHAPGGANCHPAVDSVGAPPRPRTLEPQASSDLSGLRLPSDLHARTRVEAVIVGRAESGGTTTSSGAAH